MLSHRIHDKATSNVLAWSAHASNEIVSEDEAAPDADEPDLKPLGMSPATKKFQKSAVTKVPESASLLTKALQSPSEDDSYDNYSPIKPSRRRRSFASTISIASTAEYTCDTGLTTPARTSSPSPRLPQKEVFESTAQAPRKEEKKRCISFACAAPRPAPVIAAPAPKPVTAEVPQKKSSIRFACNSRPTTEQTKPVRNTPPPATLSTPPTIKKYRSPSANSRSARSVTPKRSSNSPVATRKGWFTADSKDLQAEGSRFHEFASDEVQDDDWIRQDETTSRRKLTIDDILVKELAIRKLGKEAEEEAEQEEAEDDANDDEAADDLEDEDADDDEEDEDEEDLDLDDEESAYGSEPESEGYRTDEEVGFADSDDEDDELVLWWPGTSSGSKTAIASLSRRMSIGQSLGNMSDSSAFSPGCTLQNRIRIPRSSPRTTRRPGTPELPDSTDFVCGTLDEDRPLEDEYMSCIAAKRQEKLRLIPQDFDPSFPTSDPEDDDDDEAFKPLHRISDEHVWLHGELEDLDHEGDERHDRSKKKVTSPRRMHSPPPRARGRSPPPRRLFDRQSPPRRMRSPPPPMASASPQGSPIGGQGLVFKSLAFRPGLTHTKSLPRAPAIFTHLKTQHQHAQQRKKSTTSHKDKRHVRGAIDIVKGLEQRRQRRREKLSRQQCNRARKGLAQEKRPAPGKGAERMRELGLLMAGKIGPGNYVLSV